MNFTKQELFNYLKSNNINCKIAEKIDPYPELHILCENKDLERLSQWMYENKPVFIDLIFYLKNDIKELENFKLIEENSFFLENNKGF